MSGPPRKGSRRDERAVHRERGDATDGRAAPRTGAQPHRDHVTNQETLVEAGFARDLDLAFRAFRNEPLVTLDPAEIESLFADMVATEHDYPDDYDVAGADVLS